MLKKQIPTTLGILIIVLLAGGVIGASVLLLGQEDGEIFERRENMEEEAGYITTGEVCRKHEKYGSSILVGTDNCDESFDGIIGDAYFSITEDTVIIDEEGKELIIDDIQVGDIVSLRYTGGYEDILPMRATAEKIVLRDDNRPIGEIDCYETTENTITVSYAIKNGKKTSLVRSNKVISTWSDESKEGTIIDEGLSRNTSYNYYLVNDEQELFLDLLDRVGCRTKFQDEPKTREDCVQDIEDAEEAMRAIMSAKETEEPIEEYIKCDDVLLYKSPIGSGADILRGRGWDLITKTDWDLETEREKITMDVSDIDFYSPNFVDCPDVIDDSVSSITVMQYIGGDLYKWEELELGNDNYCIILSRPEEKRLSGEEARDLMEKSSGREKEEDEKPIEREGDGDKDEPGLKKEKSLTLLFPKEREVMMVGKTYTIKWEPSGIDEVEVFISSPLPVGIACDPIPGAKCNPAFCRSRDYIAKSIDASLGQIDWIPGKTYSDYINIYVVEKVDSVYEECLIDSVGDIIIREGYTLDPDDPTLDVPPMPEPG